MKEDVYEDVYEEHEADVQQRYFHSDQPKSTANKQHRYPTRSKILANEATTAPQEK